VAALAGHVTGRRTLKDAPANRLSARPLHHLLRPSGTCLLRLPCLDAPAYRPRTVLIRLRLPACCLPFPPTSSVPCFWRHSTPPLFTDTQQATLQPIPVSVLRLVAAGEYLVQLGACGVGAWLMLNRTQVNIVSHSLGQSHRLRPSTNLVTLVAHRSGYTANHSIE
jgi:hypothetical protein